MSDSKKYKYTRQLLKIAKQEGGYTNKEIEKKAGLKDSSSSLASRWLNGHALATERQMRYFINNYGHLLKRQMEHLYYQCVPEGDRMVLNYLKLTGDIIFKHQIRLGPDDRHKKRLSVIRVVVIEHNGRYKILLQYRAGLIEWRTKGANSDGSRIYFPNIKDLNGLVHADNEEANWFVFQWHDCDSNDALISRFNKLTESLFDGSNLLARTTVRHDDSGMLKAKHIAPMEFAFYQKLMKLGLQSELLPF
ncbi:hypothetical protein RJ45_23015 [Photobacterium gaetbulicola]|uniref:Uncharacterized protein n=1 Tax=Photobacterium gaetbulicola TaxID=1295392 RepID=A0A0B9FXQ1_9GAMM|nr:hypothetical protein [Photobacterium gaetbulicola]KHT60914.1 hypothetical protein RJ45_23015 [Photobacterium gaetbulicola]